MATNLQVTQVPIPATVVANTDHAQDKRNKHKGTLLKLGITEIVLGSCAIALGIISIVIAFLQFGYHLYDVTGLTFLGPGIWCGIFPIISGGLGVCASKRASVCMYYANMVMSIITATMMCVLFILSIMSTAASQFSNLKAIHALLLIVGLTVTIVGIVHSVYCCAGVCCTKKPAGDQVLYTSAPATPGAQYVQLANGQYMLVQNPTIITPNYPVAPVQAPGMPVTNMAPQPAVFNPPVTMQTPQPFSNVQMAQAPSPLAQIDVYGPSDPDLQRGYASQPPPYDAANPNNK